MCAAAHAGAAALRERGALTIQAGMGGLPFHKIHGCGNDFVVVDLRGGGRRLDVDLVRRIGDRRRGVGFDQLVVIERAEDADARLVFLNADGSDAGACGNGTRCAARLLGDELGREALMLETAGGRLRAERVQDDTWRVAMPAPRFGWRDVPLAEAADTLAVRLGVAGLPPATALSMGNSHAVLVVPDLAALDVETLGHEIGRLPIFPEGVNVGFAQVLERDRLRLRVFERGAGLTLACGSGACAAMVAAHRHRLMSDEVTVVVDGGELQIAWPGEGPVLMSGPTAHTFTGTLSEELLGGG